jgi:FAD-dependent urate hydroxylase
MAESRVDLLVIGAGPYGLATAAAARARGLSVRVHGRLLDFWERHMPPGMLLRSGSDWHIDPGEQLTFEAFVSEQGTPTEQIHPITLNMFRDYMRWFVDRTELEIDSRYVETVELNQSGFAATLEDGTSVEARRVLAAIGFEPFWNIPAELSEKLPPGRYAHTCRAVELDQYRDQRCLIVGGRQSAHEWAALLAEAGARAVHLVYRHDPPRFEPSDWSWVYSLVERTEEAPGWFSAMTASEQDELRQRFWVEGRLKLEPWLAPRLADERVHTHSGATLDHALEQADGSLAVTLSNGEVVEADQVLFATGYRPDMSRVSYLTPSIRSRLQLANGFPVLDSWFQTTVPGLYITGLAATQAHGPFFGFVAGCRVTARMVAAHASGAAPDQHS